MTTSVTVETRVGRSLRGGVQAETDIPFDTLPDGRKRILVLLTCKRYQGQLTTTAQVYTVDGAFRLSSMFEDFHGVIESDKFLRLTEGVVVAQHKRALGKINDILEAARGFYQQRTTTKEPV